MKKFKETHARSPKSSDKERKTAVKALGDVWIDGGSYDGQTIYSGDCDESEDDIWRTSKDAALDDKASRYKRLKKLGEISTKRF